MKKLLPYKLYWVIYDRTPYAPATSCVGCSVTYICDCVSTTLNLVADPAVTGLFHADLTAAQTNCDQATAILNLSATKTSQQVVQSFCPLSEQQSVKYLFSEDTGCKFEDAVEGSVIKEIANGVVKDSIIACGCESEDTTNRCY